MHVLFWSSTFGEHIGGVGILAEKFISALHQRGVEFLIIAPKDQPDLPTESQYDGISVYRFPFWEAMANVDLFITIKQQVAQIIRHFSPDLVHIYALNRSNFFYHLTAHEHPAPLLVTLHGFMDSAADELTTRTLGAADWVAGCSQTVIERGRSLVPKIVSRSSPIRNGLETPTVQPCPLSFDPPRLLCLGRLVKEKGMDVALSALPRILARFPQARLIIAGDGRERPALDQQARSLGVQDSVDFLGWVPPHHVSELMNTASVVVVPSQWEEPFGLVVLEAALMARPVVATRVGGIPEIVEDHVTGLLIEKNAPDSLSEAVTFLLDHREIAGRMGQAACLKAQHEFGWKGHIDAYEAIYHQIHRGFINGRLHH